MPIIRSSRLWCWLPHWSFRSWFAVGWGLVVVMLEWCPGYRMKLVKYLVVKNFRLCRLSYLFFIDGLTFVPAAQLIVSLPTWLLTVSIPFQSVRAKSQRLPFIVQRQLATHFWIICSVTKCIMAACFSVDVISVLWTVTTRLVLIGSGLIEDGADLSESRVGCTELYVDVRSAGKLRVKDDVRMFGICSV